MQKEDHISLNVKKKNHCNVRRSGAWHPLVTSASADYKRQRRRRIRSGVTDKKTGRLRIRKQGSYCRVNGRLRIFFWWLIRSGIILSRSRSRARADEQSALPVWGLYIIRSLKDLLLRWVPKAGAHSKRGAATYITTVTTLISSTPTHLNWNLKCLFNALGCRSTK